MKVAQINSVCGNGSTGSICRSISEALQESNIENKIFYGVGESEYENAEKFGGKISIRLHQLQTRLFGRHGFYSRYAIKSLLKKLDQFEPNIVHLHNIHGHYLHAGLLFAYLKAKNVKVVWTFHDCWPFTGHCAHFDFIGCTRWKSGCHGCPQLDTYPITWLFDPSPWNYAKKAEAFTSLEQLTIVSVSDWLERFVRESFFKNKRIVRIHNGVSLAQFRKATRDVKAEHNMQNKFVLLGMANKWLDEKNSDFLKCTLDHLKEDMLLALIGEKTASHSLDHANVRFVPRADTPKEMAAYYNLADVFVNLSREDTFGLVNAESMACGTPVIGFAGTASAEVVGGDGACGAIVDKEDANALVRAIFTIKEKGKNAYSDNCVERARSRFSLEQMKTSYLRLYEAVSADGKPRK